MDNWSVSSILGGLIFSTFGLYFLRRGKKDGHVPLIGIGIVLLVYPYFVQNVLLLWGLGLSLLFLGFRFPL